MLFQLQGKPISVNDAFQGKRFKTKDCKQYESDVFKQMPFRKMIVGDVAVDFVFYLKGATYAMSDISNLVKILEDCIVKRGYIEDDRKIIKMSLEKRKSDNQRVEVYIVAHETIDYEKIR